MNKIIAMTKKTIEKLKSTNKLISNNRDKILFDEFKILLSENIKYSRSVKYYADHLAISTKKLNSILKKYTGNRAKEFIEEKIISNSKKLLLETPDTIKQISYTMGFTEPTNFNKFFKKYNGTTPLQFRKELNKGSF